MAELASNRSVKYFDEQFARQIRDHDFQLNPFEQMALPHLRGRVLDFGCGMGNLAVAAARRGCSVLALDASAVASEHLHDVATADGLRIEVTQVDLRDCPIREDFDSVVSIGLLMFFDCPTALRALAELQSSRQAGRHGDRQRCRFRRGLLHVFGQDGLRQARLRIAPARQHAVVDPAFQVRDVPIRRDQTPRQAAQQQAMRGVVDFVED